MSNRYNASQAATVDQDNRNMAAAGLSMSAEINSLWATVDAGEIGITSDARDIDSLAKGGGSFRWDNVTAPGTSLLFAWLSGRLYTGLTVLSVGGGSLTLAPSAVNYVECDRTGLVTANTTAFTSGRCPLYVVTAGVSSYSANSVVSAKALLTLLGANSVNGVMLSAVAGAKEISAQLGTLSATGTFLIQSPNTPATVTAFAFVNSTTFATSDTDYWAMSVVNLGPAGTGTTPIVDAAPVNTTKVTGGSALNLGVNRTLTLDATPSNLVTAANDVLKLTVTKNGGPANLTAAAVRVDFAFVN